MKNPLKNTQKTEAKEAAATSTAAADAVAEAEARAAGYLADLQRTRADFENFRKQTEAQKAAAVASARGATVAKLLPLLDNLKLAFASYPEQLGPVAKNLAKTLAELGVSEIEATAGTPFDPNLHEAVMVEDEGGDTEVVAEVLRPGYRYEGEVLRAAMVKVKRVDGPANPAGVADPAEATTPVDAATEVLTDEAKSAPAADQSEGED